MTYKICVAVTFLSIASYVVGVTCWSLASTNYSNARHHASELKLELERRHFLRFGSIVGIISYGGITGSSPALAVASPTSKSTLKKCTDIESCREIGDQKVKQDLEERPITRLDSGVRFKRLKPGVGDGTVKSGDTVDIIFSISRANGAYMYSKGFGFEKVQEFGVESARLQSDEGLDSYRVQLGKDSGSRDVPSGIEQALIGMKKGERRRIELPPNVGFETSGWRPEPTTRRGKAQITYYKTILNGRGSNQPPFPAPTIWDVEVLSIRSK
ncbi:FKBP-type peptidyl-prolyl cis-trans isomerase [Nitzschia inconspicua]|uniref:peptidylprolyl isomerase n=1 Tax=Nitzschia inconspicua TaxID=303405 RepID=A0A9K3PKP0_9STRA|nr:FKBP-type peptidyl-prolyl cis-trans isomerase [Nitzschia inconspicua]